MEWTALFFLNSVLLGAGLSMDAFAVSFANGLQNTEMPRRRAVLIAGTFGGFQALMPVIGWALVSVALSLIHGLVPFLPWIAFAVLTVLGIKMIVEGCRKKQDESAAAALSGWTLIAQGVATSIDALTVGFTLAEHSTPQALTAAGIIGVSSYHFKL